MSRPGTDEKPFRLRAGEPLRAAVQRIAGHEIDRILDELDGRVDEEAIHEVRKATKRLRALVRLVRDQLGERVYRRENRTFRDAARALSPTRDAEVLVATIDRLVDRFGDGGHPRVFGPFRRAAREQLRSEGDGGARAARRRIIAAVRRARDRCARWPIEDDGWQVLAPGLRRIYRRGRAAWRAAVTTPTVARLHEWRKRTKNLRYALELLESVWPEIMDAFADEVDELGERLGQDHDLAMLRRFVLQQAAGNGADPHAILSIIDASRQDLQARSWTLAVRIYEATPRRFVRRLETYWYAWNVEVGARNGGARDAVSADETRRLVAAQA